jgi:hypothetical protein
MGKLYVSGNEVYQMLQQNAEHISKADVSIDTLTLNKVNTALAAVCTSVNDLMDAMASQKIVTVV